MDKEKMKAFSMRIFGDMAGSMTAGLGYLGAKTGLFRAMAGQGPMDAGAVVRASGLDGRYVEEWLKGMAAAGYLEYDPKGETFRLPDEHAFFLASDDSDHYMAGLFYGAHSLLAVAPQVARAFQEGGGVPFGEFGAEAVEAFDVMNRGTYENRFASSWLGEMPQAVSALEGGGTALDFGCGVGRVSLALARAFPRARLMGIDLDRKSIGRARDAATAEGLAERVSFQGVPIDALDAGLQFDLITACDCIHDLADPIAVLRELRARLTADGTLFVVELKAGDRLEENLHPIGAMFYGFSVFHCMTQSLAHGGAGLGNSLGPARLEALMMEAGFSACRVLDIRSPVNLFLEVKP